MTESNDEWSDLSDEEFQDMVSVVLKLNDFRASEPWFKLYTNRQFKEDLLRELLDRKGTSFSSSTCRK